MVSVMPCEAGEVVDVRPRLRVGWRSVEDVVHPFREFSFARDTAKVGDILQRLIEIRGENSQRNQPTIVLEVERGGQRFITGRLMIDVESDVTAVISSEMVRVATRCFECGRPSITCVWHASGELWDDVTLIRGVARGFHDQRFIPLTRVRGAKQYDGWPDYVASQIEEHARVKEEERLRIGREWQQERRSRELRVMTG